MVTRAAAGGSDGHKAPVIVDTDSQLITAVDVLAGNAADNTGGLWSWWKRAKRTLGWMLMKRWEIRRLWPDGSTRQAFADAGRTLIAKVPPTPRQAPLSQGGLQDRPGVGYLHLPCGECLRRTILAPAGKRTDRTGHTYHLEAFRFPAAV